jgi:hypothetical protein
VRVFVLEPGIVYKAQVVFRPGYFYAGLQDQQFTMLQRNGTIGLPGVAPTFGPHLVPLSPSLRQLTYQ